MLQQQIVNQVEREFVQDENAPAESQDDDDDDLVMIEEEVGIKCPYTQQVSLSQLLHNPRLK